MSTSEEEVSTQEKIEACLALIDEQTELPVEILNSWECKFIESLEHTLAKWGSLSVRQQAKLDQIYDKVQEGEPGHG